MGNESFLVAEFKNRWDKFRDALRREDQVVFDEMFKASEIHRDAIAAMAGNDFEKKIMAMMVEQRKIGDEVDAKVSGIENRIAIIEKGNA